MLLVVWKQVLLYVLSLPVKVGSSESSHEAFQRLCGCICLANRCARPTGLEGCGDLISRHIVPRQVASRAVDRKSGRCSDVVSAVGEMEGGKHRR
eukprot:6479169-Amphidinium_carterae.2